MAVTDVVVFSYESADPRHHHRYTDAAILEAIGHSHARVFDLGCGNGALARAISAAGHEVCGVDPSPSGVRLARAASPALRLEEGHAYEPLAQRFGTFPVVVSMEVIGHVLWPRTFIATCRDLLEPGGKLILTTPFHGYWKWLAIALSGKTDFHCNPLSDGTPFRFWSERSLSILLREAGFIDIRFRRVGRFGLVAKSVVVTARRDHGVPQ